MVAKLTKSKVLATIKSAIKESLATKKRAVVDLPGWEDYELHASKGYMYRVQTHPSTFIRVYNKHTGATAWSITASHLSGCIDAVMKRAKEFDGWAGPVDQDYITMRHPAHSA